MARGASKVTLDMKGLVALEKRIKDLNQKSIEWGYIDSTYQTDDIRNGKPIAGYAYLHEQGYPPNNLPARPFFTNSLPLAKQLLINIAPVIYALTFIGTPSRNNNGGVIYNNAWKLRMKVVADALAETVRQSIESQNFDDIKPNTKAHKSQNKDSILLETEQMYDGVQARIVNDNAYSGNSSIVNVK